MYRQLRLIGSLARKDWRLFLADRRAAVFCFLIPILLASAFGLIFDRPSQRMGACRLPVYLVVEDDSEITQQIVADLLASEHLEAKCVNRAQAEQAVSQRQVGVAILLPKGFGDRLARHLQTCAKPQIDILHHPLSRVESQWAEGVFTEIVMMRAAKLILAPLGMSESSAVERPFALQHVAIPSEANQPFNSYSHSFSGMTLQYLLFWGMESGLMLLRERQRGIWKRLRAAPAPLYAVLLGRGFSTAFIALIQLSLTFTVGYFAFGVRITGSWIGFGMLAILVSLLSAAIGLFVAAVGGTEARARHLFIVAILGISMLGGLWLPAFLLPGWVRDAGIVLPTTWAMRGMDGLTWQGHDWYSVLPVLGVVSLFTTGFFAAAMTRFYWAEKRLKRGSSI